MRLRNLPAIALGAVVLLMAAPVGAAGVTVGAGSSLALGSTSLDLGEHDLTVAGSFDAGTGLVDRVRDVTIQGGGSFDAGAATIQVCGNWSNGGTFTRGTSLVRFVDGCGRTSASILGTSTFYDLELTTSTAKIWALQEGLTTTVMNSLSLSGAPGQRLRLQSTVDGSEAYLNLQGTQSVSYVEVKDNWATGNPLELGPESAKLGNTNGWVWILAQVPALGALGLALLVLAMFWTGRRMLGRSQAALS
jgi:hypothetical protein